MAKIGVSFKMDVTKIDKARLFKGEKGTYLDFSGFIDIDQQGQYGDNGMITQDVSKDERDHGIKGNVLGNCKVFWKDMGSPQQQQAPQQQPAPQAPPQAAPDVGDSFDDDIPF